MIDFSEIKQQVLAPARFGGVEDDDTTRARLACMNIHYACLALTDFARVQESVPFYAEDFTGVLDGADLDYQSNLQFIQKRQANTERKTRHVSSNYLFCLADPDNAYAISILTLYLANGRAEAGVSPLAIADCGEKYVRSAQGIWRLRYRYLSPVAGAPR